MSKEKIEILRALLKGEQVEPIPFAFWRHFPRDDLSAERLAQKQLEYLQKFDSIFMKVSPNGRYCVIDWGCEIAFDDQKLTGSAYCTKYRVAAIEDWAALEELDVNQGMFGEQLKALTIIDQGMKRKTPFIETVFNPLMVAAKLTENRELVLKAIREEPGTFKEGLKIITKVMKEFAKISLENGASGIFLATQEATFDFLTEEEFREFGMTFDLEILKAIKNKATFNVAHIHGNNIMFQLIAKHYPVQALNWHDQLTPPPIAEAQKLFSGIIVGGIEEQEFLPKATIDNVLERLEKTISSVNGRPIIIGPGCVIPLNVPDEKLTAIISYLQQRNS
ncbi:MAG: uroporphyrinogen decarboxylase family protein [Candidatus Heimdallarchaeota archaeon]